MLMGGIGERGRNMHETITFFDELVKILRCPLSGDPLQLAQPGVIQQVNDAVSAGTARDRLEQKVGEPIEGGLVTTEPKWLYPIRAGIPTLVSEEAIDLESL